MGTRDAHLRDKVSDLGSELHLVSDTVELLGDVLVVSLDGLDIVVVHGDARGHGLGSVVAPVHKASLNLLVLWGRVELEVVDLPSDRVAPAADAPLDQDVIRHVEEHKLVSLDALLGHGLGLHSSAREAIEKPTLFFAVVGAEAIPHDADDDVIGNERSLVHVLLCHLPHVSSLGDLISQGVACGDVHHTKLLDNVLALGALSGSRRPSDDDLRASHHLEIESEASGSARRPPTTMFYQPFGSKGDRKHQVFPSRH